MPKLILYSVSLILLLNVPQLSSAHDLSVEEVEQLNQTIAAEPINLDELSNDDILDLSYLEYQQATSQIAAELRSQQKKNDPNINKIINTIINLFTDRDWTCISRNARGQRFTGHGPTRRLAARRALRNCRGYRCYIVRCRQ